MIRKVQRITSFGVFEDFTWPATLHDFKQFNLLFGWNYSGKTTFSRTFRCFELVQRHADFASAEVHLHCEGGLRTEYHNAYTDFDAEFAKYGGTAEWPVLCPGAAARGMIGTDYTEKDGMCWYDSKTFRKLYPEYHDVSDHDLSAKLYAKAGQPLVEFHPWRKLLTVAIEAIAVPIVVPLLGWACFWAGAGFRRAES